MSGHSKWATIKHKKGALDATRGKIFTRLLYVLILFAVVMVVDGLFLQPYLMKRTAKVPFWASLVTPIVLGIIIPFWGVLLAPPLLAIIYAYRQKRTPASPNS